LTCSYYSGQRLTPESDVRRSVHRNIFLQ
jgi:hypothetical protein